MEESLNLLETLAEFKDFKNIERESLMRILEDIFRSALTKKYGPDASFEVIVNVDRGELEIQRYREIVEDHKVKNEFTQIAFSEAIKIEPDFEIGEEVMENVRFSDFARREIQALRQNLVTKIIEYEKDLIYKKYEHRIGELVSGEITQVWKKEILVMDEEGVELSGRRSVQKQADKYKKGDSLSAIVLRVDIRGSAPQIIISRTSPLFLERLMETEIPEVYD
jgi:N utilization substance protein A